MAQPNRQPGFTHQIVSAMVPTALTIASGVVPRREQPSEVATSSITITKATIEPLKSLTWEQLLTLVKAAHNPRFCGPLDNAKSILVNGVTGDFCTFMAGLSYVVREALPNAPDPVGKRYAKAGIAPSGNATVNYAVTEYLTAAFPPNPQATDWAPPRFSAEAEKAWSELQTTLGKTAPTPDDKKILCSSVVKGLKGFFQKVLAGSATTGPVAGQATMVMLKSHDMRTNDRSNDGQVGYGLFGKSGSSQLKSPDFWKQIFVGDGCTKTEDEASRISKIEMFLGAMMTMAKNIEYRCGY